MPYLAHTVVLKQGGAKAPYSIIVIGCMKKCLCTHLPCRTLVPVPPNVMEQVKKGRVVFMFLEQDGLHARVSHQDILELPISSLMGPDFLAHKYFCPIPDLEVQPFLGITEEATTDGLDSIFHFVYW